MQCLSPISLPRPAGRGNADRISVPCGKCGVCLGNRRNQWSFRLEQELSFSSSAFFVTLTYDDDHLPLNDAGFPSVKKRDVQLFFKRLRKSLNDVKIRFYLCSEYGTKTFRPHYHAIIFNLPGDKEVVTDIIVDSWRCGNVVVGTVTPSSIAYVTKYCITRQGDLAGRDKPFALMSNRPGLGYSYIDVFRQWHLDDFNRFYAIKPGGVRVSLPRYYVDKIYSKVDKELHAEKMQQFYSSEHQEKEAHFLHLNPEKDFIDFSRVVYQHNINYRTY